MLASEHERPLPVRLVVGVLLAGLACAAYASAVNWFDAWWVGDYSARASVRELVRGSLVVIVPAGIGGMLWMRHVNSFHTTRRGAFWTTIGAMGWISALSAFSQAMEVDSAVRLVVWLGLWLAAILLFGVPAGWWLGRKNSRDEAS